VIAQRDEKKKPGQKRNDDDADSRAGEELEVKMLWTEKPRRTSTEKTSTDRSLMGNVDFGHYKFHKANSLP
jgi:hypothetical protein